LILASGLAIAALAYLIIFGRRYGLDLRVYRDSARAWLNGRNPYSLDFTPSRLAFTYPPFALLVLTPLTWSPFAVTQWLLWVISLMATTACVTFVLRDRGLTKSATLWLGSFAWVCASILILEPARSGVDYGQIEFVLMFLAITDLLVVPPPYRGLTLGLAAAIKLTPLIFVVVLVVRRDRNSVIRAVSSFLLWTGLAWVFWPGISHEYWSNDVGNPARVGTITYGGNQSWFAVLHRSPFPTHGSPALWVLLSLVTVALGTFVAWRCATTDRQSFAILAIAFAGLLVTPISWSHHWIWVLLIPPALVVPRRDDTHRVVRLMLWGLVALAILGPYWWYSSGPASDALDAILPICTFFLLAIWSRVEFSEWRHDLPQPDHSPMEDGATP
jgi:alpha-1,2-mannosyltransferase